MNVIFACDKNYGIGIDNKLPPWKIKGDLVRFSKLTIGDGNNVVIMGKNTYLSLPNQYLKNRQNVVVSNTLFEKYNDNQEKVTVTREEVTYSIHNNTIFLPNFSKAYSYALHYVSDKYPFGAFGEIWAIGGSLIYEQVVELNLVNKMHVTHVIKEYDCDTFLGPKTINSLNKENIESIEKCSHIGNDVYDYCVYNYNTICN